MKRRPGPENRRLALPMPPPPPRDRSPVRVPLVCVSETKDAWLLRPDAKAGAKWAPKSEVARGEGLEANLFTMPRWIAAERGWL